MGLPDKASDVISTLSPLEKIVLHNQYLLHEHSSYTFKEGDRYMLSSSSDLTNSYGVIESRLLQGDIVPSDFYCICNCNGRYYGSGSAYGIYEVDA